MALLRSSARPSRQMSSKKLAVEAKGRLSKKPSGSPSFKEGDEVRVRTPVGRLLPSTLRLVMWLGAVVVSDSNDDGHLEVLYSGNFPRDDPFRTVRVSTKDVKFPAAASSSATAAVDNAGNMASRRPTTGGKSLPLLKRLEKEMRANSDALFAL